MTTKSTKGKIEKIQEYKAREIQPNTYETKELILEEMSKKINEIINKLNTLDEKY